MMGYGKKPGVGSKMVRAAGTPVRAAKKMMGAGKKLVGAVTGPSSLSRLGQAKRTEAVRSGLSGAGRVATGVTVARRNRRDVARAAKKVFGGR